MTTGTAVRERLIVNFHGIGEPWDGVPEDEKPYWCPRAEWPAFADALAELAELATVRPEITFDDGNLSDIEDALPALIDRGLTATFHVCAGRIGQRKFVSSEDLTALCDAGMRIGSHGWSHVDLRWVGDAELDREVTGSRSRIEDVICRPVTQFAIPFGSYNRRVLNRLREYPTVYNSDRARAPQEAWLTPRMSYVRGWRPDDLAQFATEQYSIQRRLRRRVVGAFKQRR